MKTTDIFFIVTGTIVMLFLVYRYYVSRLRSWQLSHAALEQELEDLQVQLDKCVRKEERSSREASEIKCVQEKLLTTLSHEVRTPLNGIMGMATLLAETSLNEEQLDYTRTIVHSGENLLVTVNNMLASSSLQLSKAIDPTIAKARQREFGLRDCIEEVLVAFAPALSLNGPELLYHFGPAVPEQVKGDRKRLSQLLVNLVENAVRHTSSGYVHIAVKVLDGGAKNELVLGFEVADTGEGIAPERLAVLLTGTGVPEDEETGRKGLGLVICRQLAESMQGSIGISSEQGRGSTFSFSITVRRTGVPDVAPTERGTKVLLIDEAGIRRDATAARLGLLGFSVVTAAGIAEGLPCAGDVRLVFIDGDALDDLQPLTAFPDLGVVLLKRMGGSFSLPAFMRNTAILERPFRQHQLSDTCGALLRHDLQPQTKPMRILVAEDHPVNQKLAIRVLVRLGYHADIVSNGKEALDSVATGVYDLVFMDVQMPEMDGLEATRQIRASGQRQPVIVAMTANAMNGDRDECIQAGMDDYICKPLNLDELAALMQKWQNYLNSQIQ